MVSHHSYAITGLILKRKNSGEADRIITVFSETKGKLRLVVKGVRKIKSRRASHVELFQVSRMLVLAGRTWDTVLEAQQVHTNNFIFSSFPQMTGAYLVCEAIDKLIPMGEVQPIVYQETIRVLENLASAPPSTIQPIVALFYERLLIELGYLTQSTHVMTFDEAVKQIEIVSERKLLSVKLLHTYI